jgi:hypothetical protein
MANSSDNVKWYLAELVEEIQIDGESENIVHNNLILINANSPEEAYKKSMARGAAMNDTYEIAPGKKVISTFRGLSDLNPILDELEDGATIAYEELTGLSAAEISDMVPEKDLLGAFQSEDADSDSSNSAALEEAMRIIRDSENES